MDDASKKLGEGQLLLAMMANFVNARKPMIGIILSPLMVC